MVVFEMSQPCYVQNEGNGVLQKNLSMSYQQRKEGSGVLMKNNNNNKAKKNAVGQRYTGSVQPYSQALSPSLMSFACYGSTTMHHTGSLPEQITIHFSKLLQCCSMPIKPLNLFISMNYTGEFSLNVALGIFPKL